MALRRAAHSRPHTWLGVGLIAVVWAGCQCVRPDEVDVVACEPGGVCSTRGLVCCEGLCRTSCPGDGGAVGTGERDAGPRDAGSLDGGPSDAGLFDGGTQVDGGLPSDAGNSPDGGSGGPPDAGSAADAAVGDAGGPADGGVLPDAGTGFDGGSTDAGTVDGGRPDAGPADAGGAVDAGPPAFVSQIAFTVSASAKVAGVCVAQGIDTLTDAGTPLNVSAPYDVLLSTSASSAAFFADSSCTVALTPPNTVRVATGTHSQPFFFQPMTAATTTLVATPAMPTAAISQAWSVSAGPAAQLTWKQSPPSTTATFTCSPDIVVVIRDAFGNKTTSGSARSFSLNSTSAGAGALSFSNNTCTVLQPQPVSVISSDQVLPTFFMLFTGSGSTNIFVADGGLAPTPVSSVSLTGPSGSLTMNSGSSDVEPFGCLPVQISRTYNSGSVDVPYTLGVTPLTVTLPNTPELTVHTANDCSTATTTSVTTSIPDGVSSTLVYVKGHSGTLTPLTLSATTSVGYASAALTLRALPLVRRGRCTLPSGSSSVACPIGTPAIPPTSLTAFSSFRPRVTRTPRPTAQ